MSSASNANASTAVQQRRKGDKRAQDPDLVPVTHYPLAAHQRRALADMQARVARKPYAHYFRPAPLYIRREALDAIPRPLRDPQRDVLPLAQIRRLLPELLPPSSAPGARASDPALGPGQSGPGPGAENGWYAFPDGTAYVASRTVFPPECTGDMIDWWFWWHSVEPERYALWYPGHHASVRSTYATATTSAGTPRALVDSARTGGGSREVPLLERDDLPHRQRWLGSTHAVGEFIGDRWVGVRIEFREPGDLFGLGASWEELRAAGCEAAVCGVLWDARLPLKVGEMVHLWWRRGGEGGGHLELQSRYYLGHEVCVDVLGLFRVSVDRLGGWLGIKRVLAGDKVAYEQFLHDQTEFTNLASFLPDLYREFGRLQGQGVPSGGRRVKIS